MTPNGGGITNPRPQRIKFLYMACDPVGRYESFIYLNDEYMFDRRRDVLNRFVASLNFRNSIEAQRRR
jgi:hypothetical protein